MVFFFCGVVWLTPSVFLSLCSEIDSVVLVYISFLKKKVGSWSFLRVRKVDMPKKLAHTVYKKEKKRESR